MADEPVRTTASGIPIAPLYTRRDLEGLDTEQRLGNPGTPPFTRGPYESMYRGRLWTMRQFAGFGSAADANARFKFLLDQGQTAPGADIRSTTRGAPIRYTRSVSASKPPGPSPTR